MALIILIGIFAMASATFIENDFGAEVARQAVYNSRWFEVLIFLFAFNLVGSIFKRKLYTKKKFSIFLFHLAFIVMIMGAAFTRYFGYEGTMHIREGQSSSTIATQYKSLNVKLSDGNDTKYLNWPENKVLRKSGFHDNFHFAGTDFEISLKYFYNNAIEKAMPVEGGKPTIGLVLASKGYKGFVYLAQGESKTIDNQIISFDHNNSEADIYFTTQNDSLLMGGKKPVMQSEMDESQATIKSGKASVQIKKLYSSGGVNLVVQEYLPEAVIAAMPNTDNTRKGRLAYIFTVKTANSTQNLTLWGDSGSSASKGQLVFNNITLTADYGNKDIQLPFELYLDNFEVTRYPGSKSPSSYSSYVKILEAGKEPMPFHIYMNNILHMQGYRFYQSSFDNDEKGTILSVNYDSLGTSVTYAGYLLLLIGIIFSMINKNSFLRKTSVPKSIIAFIAVIGLTMVSHSNVMAQKHSEPVNYVSAEHAEKFGQLLIQDPKGRTEPVYTFASDLIRKLARKEKLYNLNPVQIFIGMNVNYQDWMDVPLIRITNKELQKFLGLQSGYASYNDFISVGNSYKLQDKVEQAYNTPPGKQNKFDKAVIKADERLNICYSIFTGSYLKMFPAPGSIDHQWHPANEIAHLAKNSSDSSFLANILPAYYQALQNASSTGNYKQADKLIEGIKQYQLKYAGYELPSKFKINLEVAYYKLNVFKKLFPFYTTIGIIFLFMLLGGIISGKGVNKKISTGFFVVILAGFMVHFLGLAARWYISGHAPMSNGYESIVFISLIILLAGLIFSRQSLLALSATSVLAGFALMVANLSFMDPQITNLVPVLKSPWLTIHVSVITSSYGFLGLGFILGIINLVLTIVQNKSNYNRIEDTIAQLTKINHRTLIVGLYLVTIGTFLGAVWANESWGRYWGWDPKETWSLITVLVYTLVTHARLIKGIRGIFAFNTLSIIGFGSVLMTFFGVNYYLSGLHSYAAGDPVPIPAFVYISVAAIISLILVAYLRFMKFHLNQSDK